MNRRDWIKRLIGGAAAIPVVSMGEILPRAFAETKNPTPINPQTSDCTALPFATEDMVRYYTEIGGR